MKILVLFLTLLPTMSFAVENCLNFPLIGTPASEYKGEISDVSSRLSFANCPDSVLVNDSFVARLTRVYSHNEEQKCVYSGRSVSFICEK